MKNRKSSKWLNKERHFIQYMNEKLYAVKVARVVWKQIFDRKVGYQVSFYY